MKKFYNVVLLQAGNIAEDLPCIGVKECPKSFDS